MKTKLKEIAGLTYYRCENGLPAQLKSNVIHVAAKGTLIGGGVIVFNITTDGSPSGPALIANLNDDSKTFVQATAKLNTGTVAQIPLESIKVVSAKQVTINVVESKTTAILLGGSVEGLEFETGTSTEVNLFITHYPD